MSKPEDVKCPNCYGPMRARTSEWGKFWGCESYPHCKGTRDSMGRSKDERRAESADEMRMRPRHRRRFE